MSRSSTCQPQTLKKKLGRVEKRLNTYGRGFLSQLEDACCKSTTEIGRKGVNNLGSTRNVLSDIRSVIQSMSEEESVLYTQQSKEKSLAIVEHYQGKINEEIAKQQQRMSENPQKIKTPQWRVVRNAANKYVQKYQNIIDRPVSLSSHLSIEKVRKVEEIVIAFVVCLCCILDHPPRRLELFTLQVAELEHPTENVWCVGSPYIIFHKYKTSKYHGSYCMELSELAQKAFKYLAEIQTQMRLNDGILSAEPFYLFGKASTTCGSHLMTICYVILL